MRLGQCRSRDFQQRVSLATPAAQGCHPAATASPTQLVGKGEDDPRAAHGDGVTEREGAAVDVDAVEPDAELSDRGDGDAAKASLISRRSRSAP